jgi:hypothetical protein
MTNELEEEKNKTEKALKKVTELINAAAILPEDQVDMDAAAEQDKATRATDRKARRINRRLGKC